MGKKKFVKNPRLWTKDIRIKGEILFGNIHVGKRQTNYLNQINKLLVQKMFMLKAGFIETELVPREEHLKKIICKGLDAKTRKTLQSFIKFVKPHLEIIIWG